MAVPLTDWSVAFVVRLGLDEDEFTDDEEDDNGAVSLSSFERSFGLSGLGCTRNEASPFLAVGVVSSESHGLGGGGAVMPNLESTLFATPTGCAYLRTWRALLTATILYRESTVRVIIAISVDIGWRG